MPGRIQANTLSEAVKLDSFADTVQDRSQDGMLDWHSMDRTWYVELCKLGLHIPVQVAPLLELAVLLFVAVPQVPQRVVQLNFHLPDDADLQQIL